MTAQVADGMMVHGIRTYPGAYFPKIQKSLGVESERYRDESGDLVRQWHIASQSITISTDKDNSIKSITIARSTNRTRNKSSFYAIIADSTLYPGVSTLADMERVCNINIGKQMPRKLTAENQVLVNWEVRTGPEATWLWEIGTSWQAGKGPNSVPSMRRRRIEWITLAFVKQ